MTTKLGVLGLLIIFLCGINCPESSAQDFLKKTLRKLENQASEELSNALVSLAMRPIRKSTNAMLKQKYKEKYGEEFDDSKYDNEADMEAALYGSLAGFYAVELPKEYVLLYEIEYEVKDENGSDNFTMMLNPDQKLFAIRSEQKGSTAIMLFDYANDIMATYDMEKKEVLAFKHAMKTAQAWNNSYAQYENVESGEVSITPLDKTKKIAKCNCDGLLYRSEDSEGTVYMCHDLPFSWADMYGGMMQQFRPATYNSYAAQSMDGVPFLVESKDTNDGSKTSMKVKKWDKRTTVIHNSDFENQFKKS